MVIEKIKIADLKPAEYNPRKDLQPGDPEYEKLKKSFLEFGYVEPIIFNKQTGNIVGGHQRLKVLQEMGETEVDCVVVELPDEKEKTLNIALNKINGEWDIPKLTDLLNELSVTGLDLTITGFDASELEKLFDRDVKEDDDFDIDKELEKEEPLVKPGDIWLLGKHRLLCGDATNPEDMQRLMDGAKANVCVTDPPYNCDYEGGTGLKIQNDKMSGAAFKEFLLKAFKNIYDNLVDGGAFYCFHSDAEKVNFFNATVEAGFHYSTTCVWVKNALVLGRLDYHMRHEPILYSFKDTAKHQWYGGRKHTTIWEFDRPVRSEMHPTCKPLDLVSFPRKNSALENSIILDPFGGSGSILIASTQINRICYMAEIDPRYATVIVKRFGEFEKSFDDVFVERDGEKKPYNEMFVGKETI